MEPQSTTDLYERAYRVLPGGVTAGARTNAALGHPFYVSRAEGPFVYNAEGRRFLDLCTSNGATLIGHGHPAVIAAVHEALIRGITCAYDGETQICLAERLVAQIPSFEMVRFTTTGTEATGYALRIARTYTGKARVIKFEGHFHGYNDALAFSFWPSEAQGGPEDALVSWPETTGLLPDAPDAITVLPFNDVNAFTCALDRIGDEIAAVVMEPINYDSGAIMPTPAFLDCVRAETSRRGIVLIFDEILSAYRTGPDCGQGYLGVTPDLTVIGKAIGGGLPLSVFGGQRALMETLSPLGSAIHTGTYNANLVPIMAAHAFLDVIAEAHFYDHLLGLSDRLYAGLRAAFAQAGLPVRVQGVGARCGIYFGLDPDAEVMGYRQAARRDLALLYRFCQEMDVRDVHVAPTWHHGLCAAYTTDMVDQVIACAGESAIVIARER